MSTRWRLLDTGIRSAAENIALDSVLLEARDRGEIPNTLRFLQFDPSAVLVGYHQSIDHEVRRNYCNKKGVDINRRITGGGAIYFDPSQLGFEIIASKKDFGFRLDVITKKASRGIVLGLERLGIKAAFRPRNDIEVNGKKISGTGGIFEGDAFLFQGTLLVDFDVAEMVRVLRIPLEKLAAHEIDSSLERVTWLSRELGKTPDLKMVKEALVEGFKEVIGVGFEQGELSDSEVNSLTKKLPHFSSKEWIEEVREPLDYRRMIKGSFRAKGGLIRVQLVLDTRRRILKQLLITGDFFISPKRTIFDLEAALKDTPYDKVEGRLKGFFEEKMPQMPGLTRDDFLLPIKEALNRAEYIRLGFSLDEANALQSVNGDLAKNISLATVLLLPYCAKPLDCEYRFADGCNECGRCTIGDAYRLAREHNLCPITIQSYKHLKEVLDRCQREGVASYIGCCCEAFFNKRQKVFRQAQMGGVLLDIDDATCYDLDQEDKALRGEFESQTNLKLELLKKVIEVRCHG